MFDNIAAISSGVVNQPIGIIRVAGPEAFDIVSKLFSGKIGKDKTITYGYIKDGEIKIDEVLVSWFKGPNTYTGDDIVEINAHGGVVITNKILKLVLSNGARIAEPGEFSRRAFMNGKIDLVKAEAIHDLIFAKTEEQATISVKKFDGETSKLIDELKEKLLNIIATCETNIDYPEYDDVETLTTKTLIPKLEEVQKDIEETLEVSKASRYISEGVHVAIVGMPNAGKSSLLNSLIGEEKAIVTNVPGTTRDIVEGIVQVGQVLLNFKDTAGIHSTKDKIEQLGIEKSLGEIKTADLIIHVVDSEKGEGKDDLLIEQSSKLKPYIKVWNKSDITKKEGITISAINNDISELTIEIKKQFKSIDLNDNKIIVNTRQLSLIEASRNSIIDSIKALKEGMTPDTVIIDIQKAWEDLANILGRAEQSDLLDEMFSNFCLGK